MKYIVTKSIRLDEYNLTSCNVPSYSKLLNVIIVGSNEVNLIFESPEIPTIQNETKTFTINLIKGLYQNSSFIDDRFIYFNTIRVQEFDFIEYYHVFYDEIKSLDELRNDKLTTIIEEEF